MLEGETLMQIENSIWEIEKNFKIYKEEYEKKLVKKKKFFFNRRKDTSGIREIEIGVLKWFEKKWMAEVTEEKTQFYIWLRTDYIEHFKQYIANKDSYFVSNKKRNIFETGTDVLKVVLPSVTTFFIGKKLEAISSFFDNIKQTVGNTWFIVFSAVIALCVCLGIFVYYSSLYIKKNNELRKQKETWVRHVEAIYTYQKEMLGYIWSLGDYKSCQTKEETERLLMDRILGAWEADNQKFQINMTKDEG